MLIALDYDGTFTEDPELWIAFILKAKSNNHRVIIATMRYPSESAVVNHQLESLVDGIVFTSRRAKKQAVQDILGEDPDIWIDDHPEWLFEDAI